MNSYTSWIGLAAVFTKSISVINCNSGIGYTYQNALIMKRCAF